MYNKIIVAGNLTRDIELKYTQSGSAIANTAIATTRKFKKGDGSQGEETLFVDLTFFGRTGEIANQYLRKGSKILVDGRLKLDQWTAQDGTKRSKHSVVVENLTMLGSKSDETHGNNDDPNRHNGAGGMNRPAHHQEAEAKSNLPVSNIPEIDINEDDIPF